MDVQMPGLSGFQATAAIRQIELNTGAHIPIVAMTASAMKGDRERCLDAGMDGYVTKPIQGRRVVEAMRSALGVRQPRVPEPMLDEAATLELVGGDESVLQEVIVICIDRAPHLLDDIERALADGDASALEGAAHSLRGMCQVFVPNDVVAIAEEVEELARVPDLVAARAAGAGLRDAVRRLIGTLGPQQNADVRSGG